MSRAWILALAVSGLVGTLTVPASAQLQGQILRIAIGAPLTGGAATFGVEMKQAAELALDEKNAAGGILGARVEAETADDEASDAKGRAVAQGFCSRPDVLGVIGHVNSNVTIAASGVYQGCDLAMITPMSSNPAVTDRGLANVFRLTNRDDHKGPGLAAYHRECDRSQRGETHAVATEPTSRSSSRSLVPGSTGSVSRRPRSRRFGLPR